jgi:hypothetical protein
MLHRFRDIEDSKGGFKLVKGIGASFHQLAKKSYDAGWVFQPEAAIDYQEKRRSPRYSFIASAELIEEQADVRIASRVSELSLHGCYLDMMNPFPTGTMVLVKISAGNALFQAKSKVVYSQPNMGAGVGFLELARGSQAVLDHWLEEAAKEQQKQA